MAVVLADYPDAGFQIVGRNPNARVRRLASASVEVTGTVPSVINHLRSATVVIVPLRAGGGTRLRFSKRWRWERQSFPPPLARKGWTSRTDAILLIADNARLFADSIIRLLRDPELRRGYEQAAAALAARYDWSQIARRFADVLREAAANFHDGQRPEKTAALLSQP